MSALILIDVKSSPKCKAEPSVDASILLRLLNKILLVPPPAKNKVPVIPMPSTLTLPKEPVVEDEPARVVPSNVKLASAFIASVPVAVRTLLLEPLDIKSETSTEIASAATSIPVPAPMFSVLLDAIVPPPVKPEPATILTPL